MRLVPKGAQKGPDIQVDDAGRKFWIEAVVASPGTGEDQVPELSLQEGVTWFRVPEEKIVLRYATVVREKYERFLDYRESGIVGPDDPYIIAVNGCKVPYTLGSCIFRSDLKNAVSYRHDRSTYRND